MSLEHIQLELGGGQKIDIVNARIQGPLLLVNRQRLRDLATALAFRGPPGGNSVVLAKNERIIATAFCRLTMGIACHLAEKRAKEFYERRGWPLPQRGVVAVVDPFPTAGLGSLLGCGVDTIFSAASLPGSSDWTEQQVIDGWVGSVPSRPHEYAPRLFIQPPWKK